MEFVAERNHFETVKYTLRFRTTAASCTLFASSTPRRAQFEYIEQKQPRSPMRFDLTF